MLEINKFVVAGSILIASACGTAKSPKKTESSGLVSIDKEYMNTAVSPKTDFFQFANGTWVKNNPVPGTESEWGSFNELDLSNKKKLDIILLETLTGTRPVGSDKQILGDYYTSFMNMETRNKAGLDPIRPLIKEIEQLETKDQIMSTIVNLHKKGVSVFFSLGVGQDLGDPTKTAVYLGQSGLGLPSKEYYFDEKKADILEKYKKHVTVVAGLYSGNSAIAEKISSLAVGLEKRIAEKMMTPVQMRDIATMYNIRSKNSVSGDKFKLEEYTKRLNFPKFDSLIVTQIEYIGALEESIYGASIEEVKSYLLWSVLNNYAGRLSDKYVQANFDFYQGVLSGTTQMKPMKEQIVEELTGSPIGELLGKAFVEKHYSITAKNKVNTMVDNLLVVFEGRIKNLSWMTDVTKKEALIKLNSIGRKLGYPEKWNDYSKITISSTDYIANLDNITTYSLQKNFSELGKPVDKSQWGMPAHMVNAYYHPLLNEIAFPAGIMQAPFFDEKREDAVNYARIGMVIGHEFTHGFDDFGSKFAANGSFTNWWTEEDRTKFDARTKTLGETFSNFCPIEGHCVNPELTMGENIADLGGLTMAYYAYSRTSDFKSGEKIDGYTPAQRFFISFAQLWKINYTDAEIKNRIANDSHSPGMFRVNGPLSNCPEFFEAFGLVEGDKMRNKDAKVAKIW